MSQRTESGGTSDGELRVTLPEGWENTDGTTVVRGLDLEEVVAARAPNGRLGLIAGRLPGTSGSVYPAAVAELLDENPLDPETVRLSRYEALRFDWPPPGARGAEALIVAPTSAGTLAVVCLAGAPPTECAQAAWSLERVGATSSSLAAGERFARLLGRSLRGLRRRSAPLLLRLRGAATASGQTTAARSLAAVHRAARRSIAAAPVTPAARRGRGRVVASLARLERAYGALGRAAAQHDARAFAASWRDVRRSGGHLQRILQGL